jgi:hypothetical protein
MKINLELQLEKLRPDLGNMNLGADFLYNIRNNVICLIELKKLAEDMSAIQEHYKIIKIKRTIIDKGE